MYAKYAMQITPIVIIALPTICTLIDDFLRPGKSIAEPRVKAITAQEIAPTISTDITTSAGLCQRPPISATASKNVINAAPAAAHALNARDDAQTSIAQAAAIKRVWPEGAEFFARVAMFTSICLGRMRFNGSAASDSTNIAQHCASSNHRFLMIDIINAATQISADKTITIMELLSGAKIAANVGGIALYPKVLITISSYDWPIGVLTARSHTALADAAKINANIAHNTIVDILGRFINGSSLEIS
ncbi:hypothetical protein HMPREF1586_01344 [Gardnerella vaginalis JCP8522]|nr:hypothetical protein HMPREF1586_01344 [Gardnerella vaginalis JCP8522]